MSYVVDVKNSQIAVIVSEDSSPPCKNAIWENESLGK